MTGVSEVVAAQQDVEVLAKAQRRRFTAPVSVVRLPTSPRAGRPTRRGRR